MTVRPSPARVALAAAFDIASVVIFVAVGRQEHDDGSPASPFGEVVAPFLIGLVVAWAVTRAWRQPFSRQSGVGVWVITVVLGMILRRALFDDGTALAFVIVATVFLAITIVGWRLLAGAYEQRGAAGQPG